VKRVAALALLALAAAGCGGSHSAKQPTADPKKAAVNVVAMIVHNRYTQAWDTLHSSDQKVAPRNEYVACEQRSPITSPPSSVKVLRVTHESVGLGDGTFVPSTAVAVRLGFPGGFHADQTVHLVAEDGTWKWILPAQKYREYKANTCPGTGGAA